MHDFLQLFDRPAQSGAEISIATVAAVSDAGISLLFPGSDNPTLKGYKRLATGGTISPGDRVVVLKLSGTYIVLGAIDYT